MKRTVKTTLEAPALPARNSSLAALLRDLVREEGFGGSALPEVRLMYSTETYPSAPVSYEPSIVIIAQGRKRGRLGNRVFTYDPSNYLVLSLPLPFECETIGTVEEPMLGMAVRVSPTTIAELLLDMDTPASYLEPTGHAIDAMPLTSEVHDAAVRLARCLRSPVEARILGPQIIREMTYWALRGGQGPALRALASPQSNFGQIARALRRMHLDYDQTLDVPSLAREAGMSVSTFHANFKAVTAYPPLRYLQTIRLHKAQVMMVNGVPVAEAANRVGYESPSQFSREFKRLFGGTPKEITSRSRVALSMFS
ncbi:transcriptional regulator, AraC family [Prosthecobacter debontii]|uniref:Transcriptional regulator, AraC family n=1 Tax=Prosthecobacter debontii TaxID=48467 RepID=A0A1T4YGQ7_9BACT|nr:AraC family transcriptional regulator [Prosthecobacter debontii]SKB00966.1 transcriptional regulator, AraC family [Prosthecobacter debontii]